MIQVISVLGYSMGIFTIGYVFGKDAIKVKGVLPFLIFLIIVDIWLFLIISNIL